DFATLTVSGGIRYDTRIMEGRGLYLDDNEIIVEPSAPGAIQKFREFDNTFSGISGSLGLTYDISENLLAKFNFSRGFRAPNIAELAANGLHEGTIRYETGNSGLDAEGSWEFDFALGFNSHHVSVEADLFDNRIGNYIFLTKLKSTAGGDSLTEGYQTFRFISGNANLYGGEISIDIHPHPWDWLHFENTFSYVLATLESQPDSMKYLPFTPGPKFQSSLKTDIRKIGKVLGNAYIRLGFDNYFPHDRIYSAYDTETATDGYTLVNFGFGTDIISGKKTLCSLYFNITNLFDVAYQSHLSRLKYAGVNYISGRTGVFDMGRNFGVKLIVPVSLRRG
ncbi:MAG TPA: TonB-dependent receptor, partial [Cyclobacteriaceae bacterium]|nr:TonB-dependent receptor [Cyclobacteriaceae bacterium]